MKWHCSYVGTGTGTGAIGGYMAAKDAGLNPWTGKANNPKPSIVIGEGMDKRVNPIAKDINSETISKSWPDNVKAFEHGLPTKQGLDFNQQWMESAIFNQLKIYNTGPVGNNSPYYHLEMNTLQLHNYQIQSIYYYELGLRVIYYRP